MLLAWTVAACRLRWAILHHEEFGVEASMAFLAAVWIPLMRVRGIAAAVLKVGIALKQMNLARRGAVGGGPGTNPS